VAPAILAHPPSSKEITGENQVSFCIKLDLCDQKAPILFLINIKINPKGAALIIDGKIVPHKPRGQHAISDQLITFIPAGEFLHLRNLGTRSMTEFLSQTSTAALHPSFEYASRPAMIGSGRRLTFFFPSPRHTTAANEIRRISVMVFIDSFIR
jgi:hypothetical protein